MKIFLLTLLSILQLSANFFGYYTDDKAHTNSNSRIIHKQYHDNVNSANDIIKRGEYKKINQYKSSVSDIISQINALDIESKSKKKLQDDIVSYSKLIDTISTKLEKKAPNMSEHYQKVIEGLQHFNSKLSSIGLSELLTQWRELSRLKNHFVRNPNSSYRKKFDAKWTGIIITITELYLDEDDEKELFDYLKNYKLYFHEINEAYLSVGYKNLNKLKPLTYKIKAQLELLIPYKI